MSLEEKKALPSRAINAAARRGLQTQDQQLFAAPQNADSFTKSEPWRVFRIMGEFVAGFDTLADLGPAVTLFGSARTGPTTYWGGLVEWLRSTMLAEGKIAARAFRT